MAIHMIGEDGMTVAQLHRHFGSLVGQGHGGAPVRIGLPNGKTVDLESIDLRTPEIYEIEEEELVLI